MPLRLTRATLLALALLLSQTSCGGPLAHVETAARVLPLVLPKEPKPKPTPKPRPVVAVTDSAIVVKHGDQIRVIRRDDDDGDGEPDEDY